jgi:hypothetical protein
MKINRGLNKENGHNCQINLSGFIPLSFFPLNFLAVHGVLWMVE